MCSLKVVAMCVMYSVCTMCNHTAENSMHVFVCKKLMCIHNAICLFCLLFDML
uniref:Uncharacterized protein n=1 Tax=Anguilla anguilla TaxID=7936 RepID=A0A0E9V7A5_ANGAN